MSGDAVLLHGVPEPFPFEAPSSWLGRLSLAQGCPVEEAKRFLGFPSQGCRDVDSVFRGVIPSVLRERCGLPASAFSRTEAAVNVMSPRWLRTGGGWPRFYYCPLCLSQRPTPYLDIHWRFLDVASCLVHGCRLLGKCPECSSPVSSPTDVFTSLAGRSGHASQSHCQKCAGDMASAAPSYPNPDRLLQFTRFELRLLEHPELTPPEVPVHIRDRAKAIREWPWPTRKY
jgi:hypothetical protein